MDDKRDRPQSPGAPSEPPDRTSPDNAPRSSDQPDARPTGAADRSGDGEGHASGHQPADAGPGVSITERFRREMARRGSLTDRTSAGPSRQDAESATSGPRRQAPDTAVAPTPPNERQTATADRRPSDRPRNPSARTVGSSSSKPAAGPSGMPTPRPPGEDGRATSEPRRAVRRPPFEASRRIDPGDRPVPSRPRTATVSPPPADGVDEPGDSPAQSSPSAAATGATEPNAAGADPTKGQAANDGSEDATRTAEQPAAPVGRAADMPAPPVSDAADALSAVPPYRLDDRALARTRPAPAAASKTLPPREDAGDAADAPLAAPALAGTGQRPSKPPIVIITGASGGIGRALAEQVARPGLCVALVGRNPAGLDAATAAVERRGSRAVTSRIDITTSAFEHWADTLAERYTLKALFANAGLCAGPADVRTLESADDTERLVRTNLLGTVSSVRIVVDRMRSQTMTTRPERHIGIIASVAGLLPTPDLAVYSATKAGLIAYGHALRPRLIKDGISVTVVCPGFVTTPMSARHKGAKPFEISAERAAAKILAAVEAGRRTAVFPFPYRLLSLAAAVAPGAVIDRLVPSFRAEIAPDRRVDPGFKSQRLDRPRFDQSADQGENG